MKRILHVWDQSGVGCILAKYQRKNGYEADIIKRKGFDSMGIFSFYGGKEIKAILSLQFFKKVEKYCEVYDILHIHDLYELIPRLRKKFPDKKIILHYHGSKLRNTPKEKRSNAESMANAVIVSTPDLTKYTNAIYLPNPVDLEHFSPKTIKHNGRAVCIRTKTESRELISRLLEEHNISLVYDMVNREQKKIPYKDMPTFLGNYEYLIDLKNVNDLEGTKSYIMPAYSMLGLQALAMGLKVINYNFETKKGLPIQHDPNHIVKDLTKIYEK